MAHSRYPLLDTYRKLTAQQVERTNGLLRFGYPRSSLQAELLDLWRPVPDHVKDIENGLGLLGTNTFRVMGNTDLTNDAKERQIGEFAEKARDVIQAHAADVLNRSQSMIGRLKDASMPARPQPDADGAAQEAALSGLKTDIRMLLDGAKDGNVVQARLRDLLDQSLVSGDDLRTWLLATSGWPDLYLTSRDLAMDIPMWSAQAADALDTHASPELAPTRRLYRQLSDPQGGLPVIDTLLCSVLPCTVNDLADWRPSAGEALPPMGLYEAAS
jgi:hypothetical protein